MLRKLLKYEVKATARVFLPLYALLLLFTGLNHLFFSLNISSWNNEFENFPGDVWARTVQGISVTLYIVIIVAICVMTLVVTVQRFYKNLLGEEGYLMNTLPVTPDQQIVSKMLVSLLWQVLSMIMAAISILLLVVNRSFITAMGEFLGEASLFYTQWTGYAVPITFEIIILTIVAGMGGVLTIYAAIMVGSLCSKHRLLASFGVYIGFGVAENIIGSAILSIFGNGIMKWMNQLNESADPAQINALIQTVLIGSIVSGIIFSAIYYFVTRYMLSKKLDLE